MSNYAGEKSNHPLDNERIALPGFDVDVPVPVGERSSEVSENVRRRLGEAAEKLVNSTFDGSNGVYLYHAAQVLPWISPPEKRLEVALALANHENSRDQSTHTVVSMVPEVLEHGVVDPYSESDPEASARVENLDKSTNKVIIPSTLRKRLRSFNPFGEKEIDPMLVSPLHMKAHPNEVVSLRKSGSETYILPKKHEASVRVIRTHSASAWLEAADPQSWYERGFDYVPIEPILAIDPTDKDYMVAVTTTNLRGQSLLHVASLLPKEHLEQLYIIREEIRDSLSKRHIMHHHLDDEDFVVVPYVDESGKPDLSRCPRLYAIDFDQASIAT